MEDVVNGSAHVNDIGNARVLLRWDLLQFLLLLLLRCCCYTPLLYYCDNSAWLPYLHYRDYWLVLPKYGSSSVARTCACQLVKGWDHSILLLSPDPLAGIWHLAYDPLSGTTPLCFCTNLPVLRHPPSSPSPLVQCSCPPAPLALLLLQPFCSR